jgi:hypothetical protein
VAIKKGQTREKAAGFREMGTLRCEGCGEEFSISHDPAFADKWVAEKQAGWVEKVLAEEHERDKKHPDESNCRSDPHERSYFASRLTGITCAPSFTLSALSGFRFLIS